MRLFLLKERRITLETQQEKKSSRNAQYEPLSVRMLLNANLDVDHAILTSLYHHRALTAKQVHRIALPHLHENSVRNRLRTLAERKVLNVNTKAGLERTPVHLYSLSAFGLLIFTEDILGVDEYEPETEEPKYHYTLDDLKVKTQFKHHYQLQDWLSRLLEHYEPSEILHCEWRRFPLFDEEGQVPYRPDWIFFRKNQALQDELMHDISYNPLLIPYHARKTMFDYELNPLITIECDLGTMSKRELRVKWEAYKKSFDSNGNAIALFYPNENKNNAHRHYNVRNNMIEAFEDEILAGSVQLIEGDEIHTVDSVRMFMERDGDFLKEEPMVNVDKMRELVTQFAQNKAGINAILVSEAEKSVVANELKMPVIPDRLILGEGNKSMIHMVFFAQKGWVNPVGKAKLLEKWVRDGNLSIFDEAVVILLYPEQDSILNDIPLHHSKVYYAAFNQLVEEGKWGKVWERTLFNKRKVTWNEVEL